METLKAKPPETKMEYDEILVTTESIAARVATLGEEITAEYEGTPLVLITIINGSIVFTADLMRQIKLPLTLDSIRASSYLKDTRAQEGPSIHLNLQIDIENQHILLIDDILDTGYTLHCVMQHLQARNPASIKTCVLLDKPARREKQVNADFVGFTIPDEFVVGYGLDYDQQYRNLPFIAKIKSS